MFKVTLGDISYHVVFAYEHPGEKKFGKRKAKTNSVMCHVLKCVVPDMAGADTSVWEQVSFGISKQFQGGNVPIIVDGKTYEVYADADCYKKSEGRKLAFERALAGMALGRAERSAFWAGYASMLPKNGNGETKWK